MNEQITTATELDALPVGVALLGDDGHIWQKIDNPRVTWQSLTGGGFSYVEDFVATCAPLTVLYRPDAPERTKPTEEQVAWAIAGVYGETCAWGREKGKVCGLCDCNGMTEAYARQAARAVLDLLPQRVAPSEEQVARSLHALDYPGEPERWEGDGHWTRDDYRQSARLMLSLCASQPTVAEVRAQALKDAAHYLRAWGPSMDEAARQIDHLATRRAERGEA